MESVHDKERLSRYTNLKRGAAIIDGRQEQFRQDGYTNLLNKYGTKQDNSTAYNYSQEPISNDMELVRLYEGNGLFTKIIDRPSEEAVKHGLDIDFGDENIAEYVESRLDELEFEDKFATAEKWARLYGGSIIVMLVDDGCGLEEPLNWNNVRSIEELRVFERAVVQPDYSALYNFNFEDTIGNNKPFGEPEYYQVFSIYGYFIVHRSRCLVFRNGRLPEHTTNAIYRYWGIPEYVKIKRALRECITSHEDGVKLLERSVQAIYKMKNLANMLSTSDGEDKVLQRLQVIDMARGILNSIAIDTDGEDYDFKTLGMTGVKDVIDSTCNMLSAVTNMPQTVLFGRSPAGMLATGESDLENYYNMVENIQKQNMKSNARTLIDLILKQGKIEGKVDEIPKYKTKFAPLWSMSETEKAQVEQAKAATALTKAQTAQLYMDANVLDPTEVRNSLAENGDFEIEETITEDNLDLPDDTFDIGKAPMPKETDNTETDSVDNDAEEYQASAVLIIHDGKVLCASRHNSEGLCGPGGKIEQGELPEDTAVRESVEEFNIVPLNIIPYGEYKGSTGSYLKTKLYFTDQFTGTPEADNDEMFDAKWYTLEELQYKQLFPPFAEGLELFLDDLKHLTNDAEKDTLNVSETDGGPGSGRYPKGSGGLSDKQKKKLAERLIGEKTSDGVVIKEISIHAFDRIGGRNISAGRVEKTLTEGIPGKGNSSSTTTYDIPGSRAVVNHETGKIVSFMWRSNNK
jgi:phage-related protein (TIGR01555 family)